MPRLNIDIIRGLAETINQYFRDTTDTKIAIEIERSDGRINVNKFVNGECIEPIRSGNLSDVHELLRGMVFVLRENADITGKRPNFEIGLKPHYLHIIEAYKHGKS